MRAVCLHSHGDVESLTYEKDFPDPKVVQGQVVIKVAAASLNYHDVFTCRGMPGIKVPLPMIIGIDFAGEIVEVGDGVEDWKAGDRVLVNPLHMGKGLYGEMMPGGTAEYCLVEAPQLIAMPDGVSYEQAAALPVAYGTAHRMMITNGAVAAGEKVLILGASGGVGTCCVQLAKMVGAEVIACASTPKKLAALDRIGADHLINYREKDFVKEIWGLFEKPHRRTYSGGVDVVVNYTGGETWVPSFRVLRRGGRLLTCGATAAFDPKTDIRYIWTFELKILGANGWTPEDIKQLLHLVAEGKIDPVIEKILPLEQTQEGVRMLRDREVIGKIIIKP